MGFARHVTFKAVFVSTLLFAHLAVPAQKFSIGTVMHLALPNGSVWQSVLRIHDIFVWIWIRIRIWIRGSMPLTHGSGSCYFRHWPSRRQQKTIFLTVFLLITFWRYPGYIYIIFHRQKVKKKSQSRSNQGFTYFFYLVIEGSGSVSLTNGSRSGSRRAKNIRIRRIRIRNTGDNDYIFSQAGFKNIFIFQFITG